MTRNGGGCPPDRRVALALYRDGIADFWCIETCLLEETISRVQTFQSWWELLVLFGRSFLRPASLALASPSWTARHHPALAYDTTFTSCFVKILDIGVTSPRI